MPIRSAHEIETPNELWTRFFDKVDERVSGNKTCLVWKNRASYRMWVKTEHDGFGSRPRLPHHVHYYIVNGEFPKKPLRCECGTKFCCNSAHWS